MAAVRPKPILMAACVLVMLLAAAGAATASTLNGGISSLGSGYARSSTAPAPTGAAPSVAPPASDAATLAPGATLAPSAGVTTPMPAPTILGLESPPDVGSTSGIGGVGGFLIVVVALILVARGVGYAVYRVAAARSAKP